MALSASASLPISAKPNPRGCPVKRSRKSVSESGWTPISENNAAICSSVALNDRLPTYNFFTVVLLLRPANAPAQNTRLKRQEIGRVARDPLTTPG